MFSHETQMNQLQTLVKMRKWQSLFIYFENKAYKNYSSWKQNVILAESYPKFIFTINHILPPSNIHMRKVQCQKGSEMPVHKKIPEHRLGQDNTIFSNMQKI